MDKQKSNMLYLIGVLCTAGVLLSFLAVYVGVWGKITYALFLIACIMVVVRDMKRREYAGILIPFLMFSGIGLLLLQNAEWGHIAVTLVGIALALLTVLSRSLFQKNKS